MNSNSAGNYGREDGFWYDQQVADHDYHGHEVMFGLMYEYVHPGETLLDIGIGTGLSSLLFHKAGLVISGFDFAEGMLKACESKGFAAHLVLHDLRQVPFPYPDDSFDHIVSLGVLNFYPDLAPVFQEASRIIRPRGAFGFSVEELKPGQQAAYVFPVGGQSDQERGETGVNMYRHSDAHVRELLGRSGFSVLKGFEFLADRYPEEGIDVYLKAYVARKVE